MLVALAGATCVAAADEPPVTPANVMVELAFEAAGDHEDPFNAIELDIVFTGPGGDELKVPAFWAGGNQWRVRFSSPTIGLHHWRSFCSAATDAGLHDRQGAVRVEPYEGDNRLYRHGPIVVAANRRHFQHLDGQPFLWIGDTQWMALCKRLRWPDDFQTLVSDRRDKGFNVIQLVAGPYPDMGPFDPRGENEAGSSWEKKFTRINPNYYNLADRRVMYIADQGIVPCIVGVWGYYLDWMGEEKMCQHWRHLIARYGALPVVWCIAGEANLPWYLDEGFPFDDREQVQAWTRVTRHVRSIEPFGRPFSIHPTGLGKKMARGAIDDPSLIDFDMLQTGHSDVDSLEPTVRVMREAYAAEPRMPTLNSEVCYEGILGKCDASVQRLMLWASLLSGGCGHTYGANGIWQINGRDKPYGKSPHGGDWGQTPWQDAMKLPGSTQVPLAAKLLTRYPWANLAPMDDAVSVEPVAGADRGGPFAGQTDDGALRIVYLPTAAPVRLHKLIGGRTYAISWFDPITGQRHQAGELMADADGNAEMPGPPRTNQDWVLVVELDAKARLFGPN